MKPNASLKSLNVNFLVIASRPSTSLQPSSLASALLRVLPVSFSAMAMTSAPIVPRMRPRRPLANTARTPTYRLKGRPVGPPTRSDAAGDYDVLVAQYRQDRRNGGPHPRHFPVVFRLDLRRELGRGRTAGRLARSRFSGAVVRVRGSA